jgi:hypothetical protein
MREGKDRTAATKVMLGFRVEPELKAELEALAAEISHASFPASVTAGELAAVAIREYLDRHRRKGTKGKS